ncbi:hypothetical protein AAEO56_17130 [Flavobacterium sp. DGU11]|uniref:Uncharacterized protein n=1 Tax=Flavobacterium arundinis TaxID=3139143 RepID=A0ABU9I0Q0_9FLAO
MMAKYRAILIMTITALLLYAGNWFFLSQPEYSEKYSAYHYNLATLYCFFWLCAAIIVFAVYICHTKSKDNTGYIFVGATLLQMGLCYLMLRPILAMGDAARFEKINFFIVFLLFLAIETLLTIRLLNNKQ